MRELIVGGLVIPREAGLVIDQDYTWEEPVFQARMVDGDLKQQQSYAAKLNTTVRGRFGLIPSGLDGLDFAVPMTLSCIRARAVTSQSHNIVITANRRSDAGSEPMGFAQVGRRWEPTPLVMNGDTAQLTQVPGATLYQVKYFPEILAYVTRPVEKGPVGKAFEWSFNAREK